ncbi:MAG: glycerophosphodiester phosphodiesterase family protein [Lachnospiraceae bacterium]|jgi:glycerophosphoryl diester phosphodiesterase|nr:glycerophosphodiester phosphodiesterase family protein [Lachnospiraceae bacterium]MEE3460273.1 glycerophosphodiester phosphodiesterase family protein [Lachnospiraceae bacterium]
MKKDLSILKTALIAHRGLHNESDVPENSMPAFEKAVEAGLIIELDIHILKDGEIIVFHDDDLKRMCGIDRPVADYTFKELSEVKLLKSDIGIPKFKDVLDMVGGRVPVIVEFKYDTPVGPLEAKAARLLDAYKGPFVIKSFHPMIVRWFKLNRPQYIRGLLIPERGHEFRQNLLADMWLEPLAKPDFLSVDYHLCTHHKVMRFKKKMPIIAWTIKSQKTLFKYSKYFDNMICEDIFDEKLLSTYRVG